MSDGHQAQAAPPGNRRLPWWAAAIVAVLAVGVGLAAFLLFRPSELEVKADEPVIVSVEQLRSFAEDIEPAIYWAGERGGSRLELTRTARDETFVRYLPAGVGAGDERSLFTTVATYPMPRAYEATLDKAKREGGRPRDAPGGGRAIIYPRIPRSVYLVYPDRDQLVEIYDRKPEAAKQLALSDRIRPIR